MQDMTLLFPSRPNLSTIVPTTSTTEHGAGRNASSVYSDYRVDGEHSEAFG